MVTVSKAAVLKLIFDSVGRPATEIYQKVRELPGVEAEPVRHGRWERTGGNPYPSCSECGCESLSRADRPYCQFCGAKMSWEREDDE